MRFAAVPALFAFVMILSGCTDGQAPLDPSVQFAEACVSVDGGRFYCEGYDTCDDGSWRVDENGNEVCVPWDDDGGIGDSGGGGYTGGGGGGNGGGSGSTGGGGTSPPATITMDANDMLYDCHTGDFGVCDLREITATERQTISDEIDLINPDIAPFCSEVRQVALQLFNRAPIPPQGVYPGSPGGFQVWDNQVTFKESDGRIRTLYGDAKNIPGAAQRR
jgi:hypothetical protein